MKKLITLFVAILLVNFWAYSADLTVTGNFPNNDWNNNALDYKMTEIGTSGVYMLEKTLPAGSYEYKVFYSGTWSGPGSGDNRKFTLSEEKTVKFYAKENSSIIYFFCDAQQLYVIGSTVGDWETDHMKLMTNSATDATYTGDVVTGEYKIVSLDKNGNIVWDDITPSNQSVSSSGNYTIKLDFETFTVSATLNGEPVPSLQKLSNSYIFVGQNPNTATWYNGSATYQSENFNGKKLGSITSTLYIGGEITTTPVMDGVTVKMYYQIDDLDVKEITIPWDSNDGTTSTKWKCTEGTNVFSGYTLSKGNTYSLKVWFYATDGSVKLWDSNLSQNYVATFTYDIGTKLVSPQEDILIQCDQQQIKVNFEGNAQIKLYSVTGQLLTSKNCENEFTQQVKPGIYLLQLNGKSHKIVVR